MTTYYVSDATGSDSDDGLSEDDAFLTIDKAMNTVSAGDLVYVKADGTYTENAVIDTAGGRTTWIVYEGYTTTPGDGGQATIDASGLTNAITVGAISGTDVFTVFRNFILDGADAEGYEGAAEEKIIFINTTFSNNSADGLECDNENIFYKCLFTGNGIYGADLDNNNMILYCTTHSNTDDGIHLVTGVVAHTVTYNPASGKDGIVGGESSSTLYVVLNCTADGDNVGSIGIKMGNSACPTAQINNILHDWATGLGGSAHNTDGPAISYGNLFNSNTANRDTNHEVGYSGTGWSTSAKGADINGAPAFTDEANDDYTLAAGSPALGAGVGGGSVSITNYIDIGAHQKEPAAGGGAVVIPRRQILPI